MLFEIGQVTLTRNKDPKSGFGEFFGCLRLVCYQGIEWDRLQPKIAPFPRGFCRTDVPSAQSSLTHNSSFPLPPSSPYATKHTYIMCWTFRQLQALPNCSGSFPSGSLPPCRARNKVVFCCSQNPAAPPCMQAIGLTKPKGFGGLSARRIPAGAAVWAGRVSLILRNHFFLPILRHPNIR